MATSKMDFTSILKLFQASQSKNIVDELYTNMIEQTYFKSPLVAESYSAPYNPDDLYKKRYDYSIYETMLQDDQVAVCLQLKKDLILGDGGMIVTEDSEQDEIEDDIEKALFEDYEGSFNDDIEEILSAYEFGFSITEKIFKQREDGKLGLKCLRTRHPNSWLLHQDDKGNIIKFEQRTSAGNLDVNPKALIHYTVNKRFQNPYGQSELRPAYNAWLTKTHIVRYFSIFMEKAASPIPVGRFDKNAPEGFSDTLLNILKKFQTKTAITIPKDVEIEFLEAKSNGDAYHKAIHIFNMFIGRALFIPDLLGFTGSETGGGSLALGKEQMNLFFMHIMRKRKAIEDLINNEIIKPIVKYNFGEVESYPKYKFKPLDDMKAIELAKVWLDAVKGKAFQPNEEEINHFRKLVKFPEGDVIPAAQPPSPFGSPSQIGGNNGKDNPEIPLDNKEAQKEQPQNSDESNIDKDAENPKEEAAPSEEPEKKEFAKVYDAPNGDYSKKVDFKMMKTKLDDYDNSVLAEAQPIVKKMLIDLKDQIEKKKIIQNQKLDRIDSLNLKYKKELKQILKNSFMGLYKDAQAQAATEVQKSNFSKPLTEDKFLEAIDTETFAYIGDYEYQILKRTRLALIQGIKDGKSLVQVLNELGDDLDGLSQTSLERFSRTKHTEVMNNARREYFESTDVVTGYQYSAIMDDRTTDICAGLHGKFFKADDAPTPPMHFNCRSTLIPITKYEEFKPTESIIVNKETGSPVSRASDNTITQSIDDFIELNKGDGFSKYSKKEEGNEGSKVVEQEILKKEKPEITDPRVSFETEFLEKEDITTYSLDGKAFQKSFITYKDETKKDILKLKNVRLDNDEKV